MQDPVVAARARGRRMFLIVGAVFLLPVLVSFALYFGGLWKPSASAAKGELLQPPPTVSAESLRTPDGAPADAHVLNGKWSLIYIGDGACDEACRTALAYGRQTRLALGRDMQRVQRVFLSTANCCDHAFLAAEHDGLVTLDASSDAARALLARFPGAQATSVYIVDPNGNLMMRHDATQVINKDLLTDLKKLLKLSHIG